MASHGVGMALAGLCYKDAKAKVLLSLKVIRCKNKRRHEAYCKSIEKIIDFW